VQFVVDALFVCKTMIIKDIFVVDALFVCKTMIIKDILRCFELTVGKIIEEKNFGKI